MKRFNRFIVILATSLAIALFGAGLTYTADMTDTEHLAASLALQETPAPLEEEDRSEVGSTDGIVMMGGVIALIVLVPVLVQWKSWMQPG